MAERVVRLPDVGEGIAEAELVEWHVKVGDVVREDAVLGAVMTDKATVEIPSPTDGRVIWLAGKVGDLLAIGSDFVRLEVDDKSEPASAKLASPAASASAKTPGHAASAPRPSTSVPSEAVKSHSSATRPSLTGDRPLAAPAVRLRAREAGIDLRRISGSGPAGRITHDDLDAQLARGRAGTAASPYAAQTAVTDIKIVGLRRKIAEKMSIASSRIPHITYVEEVDVTSLEDLRTKVNGQKRPGKPKLTLLPFLMRAMVRAIAEQPHLNAHFDDEAGIVRQHAGVHIGIATQTPAGLMVPVVRHTEARGIWDCATEVARLAEAARNGNATRDELTGSTITITSLGALGGLVTTPIINHPEVAIIGVNRIAIRPYWNGAAFVPRQIMNMSSSFDHRVIDGFDAAQFVQRIKLLLETPAMIFID
ncbi:MULTISPECIES: dihydrolipoamide acetyltransferase family protein [Bradyrhizobium]|uniref:Dihydrolipoamide acetyltransferase component of pyruvate dehydrogenase complex n=1 Tax=Bradyrhizobium vignae TaxID=1549949 RepID=A0A2U3PWB4_9BRAD|nr:dihydrolipoamide acetyltransferase family protein [Bradyrhizobium vignae]RXG83994.1 2-oxo acid dehydrogenase subunit E2 [Bradyrhizobium vignae]SPP93450.1 Lipoamide acyltransferase component of branched-chain alpha-keto acid dehydrogenase complex [Bradyrhizobium vignae]